jgi:ParB family chromosome partitioning protein
MAEKRGLGRGLGALIGDGLSRQVESPGDGGITARIPVLSIERSQWQPRRHFDEQAHLELTESIREHGVLQPLLLRKQGDTYALIAGERRLRAAIAAGLEEVPARIMDATDESSLEIALIENLQRRDLDPIEEAEGYDLLIRRFGLTQERVSERVGKPRATVANALRLLSLPQEVRDMVSSGRLSAGHAKVLSGLSIPEEQTLLARRAAREQLSVRQLERILQRGKPKQKTRVASQDVPDSHLNYLSERLHRHFGTAVTLNPCRTLPNGKKEKGSIEISYYSSEELDRILSILGVELD